VDAGQNLESLVQLVGLANVVIIITSSHHANWCIRPSWQV